MNNHVEFLFEDRISSFRKSIDQLTIDLFEMIYSKEMFFH